MLQVTLAWFLYLTWIWADSTSTPGSTVLLDGWFYFMKYSGTVLCCRSYSYVDGVTASGTWLLVTWIIMWTMLVVTFLHTMSKCWMKLKLMQYLSIFKQPFRFDTLNTSYISEKKEVFRIYSVNIVSPRKAMDSAKLCVCIYTSLLVYISVIMEFLHSSMNVLRCIWKICRFFLRFLTIYCMWHVILLTPLTLTCIYRREQENMTVKEVVSLSKVSGCINRCRQSRYLVLIIVFIALFLDNMLLSVVG
jgi:hypothetical protein